MLLIVIIFIGDNIIVSRLKPAIIILLDRRSKDDFILNAHARAFLPQTLPGRVFKPAT